MFVHPHALCRRDNGTVVANHWDIVSPPFYLTTNANIVSVSPFRVEQMTLEETSSWVWRYCHHQGWDEAGCYAENFKEQAITGRGLRYLSDHDLKISLKIINPSHRNELLSAVGNLFQSHTIETKIDSEVQTSVSTLASPCQIVYPVYIEPHPDSSVYGNHNFFSTGVTVNQSFESSAFSTPVTWSSVGCQSVCESIIPYTCLPNTIGVPSDSNNATMPSQNASFGTDLAKCVQTDMSDMVSDKRSCGAGCTDIYGHSMPSENVVNSTMEMHERKNSDIKKPAKHALNGPHMQRSKPVSTKTSRCGNLKKLLLTLEPDQIPKNRDTEIIRSWFLKLDSDVKVKPSNDVPNAYTIIFQSEDSAIEALKFKEKGFDIRTKYRSRVSPNNPVEFKALCDLQIREGKSLNGKKLAGVLKRGETVEINQIKGRRARLVNGGWVSLNTENGKQLLKRLSDS